MGVSVRRFRVPGLAAIGVAILVTGAVAGGAVVAVRDQQRADASRQHALSDLAIAGRHFATLDAVLQSAEPKFDQTIVSFSKATTSTDYANLYLVSDPTVPQAEGPAVDDYVALKRDLDSFQSAMRPSWVREPDARTLVDRIDAAAGAYREAQKASVELAGQYRFLSDIALVFTNLDETNLNATPDEAINNASQLRLTLNGIHQDLASADLSPTFARYVAILDSLVANYSDYATAFENQNEIAENSALRRLSNDVTQLGSFDWIGASHYVDSKFATALGGFEADIAAAKG